MELTALGTQAEAGTRKIVMEPEDRGQRRSRREGRAQWSHRDGDEGTGEPGRTGVMMGQGGAEGALRQVEPIGRRTGVEPGALWLEAELGLEDLR